MSNQVKEIFECKSLKLSEKVIMIGILTSPGIAESNLTIAEKLKLSLPTVLSAIRNLHQKGYIDVKYEVDGHTSPQRKIEVIYGKTS